MPARWWLWWWREKNLSKISELVLELVEKNVGVGADVA